MPYAVASDMEARYKLRDLVALTDPANASVQAAALNSALQDASDLIDGYLEGRYPLPLANPPRLLKQYACDIAMYKLQALRPQQDIEDARKRFDDVIKYLQMVAQGTIALGLNSDNHTVADSPPAVLTTPTP